MGNLKTYAVIQISQSGNHEGFVFSRAYDDQLIKAYLDSDRIKFELLRIEDDMNLRFMHVIGSIKMTALLVSLVSVFSLK